MTKLVVVVLALSLVVLGGCAVMTSAQSVAAPYCLPSPKMKKSSMEPYC